MKAGRPRKTKEQVLDEIKNKSMVLQNGCVVWKGSQSHGYGAINFGGRQWRAHRLVFSFSSEPLQNGLQINHTCDTPLCINIDHLYQGTQADNMRDRDGRGRRRTRVAFGEQSGRAKLTEKKVCEIRELAESGWSQYRIAKKFGIASSTAWRTINHANWRHLSGDSLSREMDKGGVAIMIASSHQ